MSTPLRLPPLRPISRDAPGESGSLRARPVVLSPDRIARGLELAHRDPRTAVRVAVVAHGRLLSALDRRTRGLMWHGCRPRRFLTRELSRRHTREELADHSKIAEELATWWHVHADELNPDWPSRLLATIHAVAHDRWHFPQLSTVSWTTVTGVEFVWQAGTNGQVNRRSDLPGWVSERPDDRSRYLEQLREFRADLLEQPREDPAAPSTQPACQGDAGLERAGPGSDAEQASRRHEGRNARSDQPAAGGDCAPGGAVRGRVLRLSSRCRSC